MSDEIRVLLNNLYGSDSGSRDQSIEILMKYQKDTPGILVANFLQIIFENSDLRLTNIVCISLYSLLSKTLTMHQIAGFPQDILNKLKEFIIFGINNFVDTNSFRIERYPFDVLSRLMKLLVVDGGWSDIIAVLLNLLETSKQRYAIKCLNQYANICRMESNMMDFLVKIFMMNASDEASKVQQVAVFLTICNYDANFFMNIGKVSQILLEINGLYVDETLQLIYDFLRKYEGEVRNFELITDALLSIINSNKSLEGKIASAEFMNVIACADLVGIQNPQFFEESLMNCSDQLLGVIINVFSNQPDDEDPNINSILYDLMFELAEKLYSDTDTMDIFASLNSADLSQFNDFCKSSIIRLCLTCGLNEIFQLMQCDNKLVQCNYVLGVKKMLSQDFVGYTQLNQQLISDIFEALITLVQYNDLALDVIRVLFEGALENSCSHFLSSSISVIEALVQSKLNYNTLFLVSVLAKNSPEQVYPLSVSILNKLLELLQTEEPSQYLSLFCLSPNLIKVLPKEEAIVITKNMLLLANERLPDLLYETTIKILAEYFAKDFTRECIDIVIKPIIDLASQPISFAYLTVDERDDESMVSYYSHVDDLKIGFKTEDVKRLSNCLENLVAIVEVLGQDAIKFGLELNKIINTQIQCEFDKDVRALAFSLVGSLMKIFPGKAGADQYMPLIKDYLTSPALEPEITSRQKAFDTIKSVIEHPSTSDSTLLLLLEIIPLGLDAYLKEFEKYGDKEAQDFLECAYSIMYVQRAVNLRAPELALKLFTNIILLIDNFNMNQHSIIQMLKVALTSDFIEDIVDFPQADDLLNDVVAQGCQSEFIDVRRVAMYGIGRCIAKKQYSPEYLDDKLNFLYTLSSKEELRTAENEAVTECAISSYVLILKKRLEYGNCNNHLLNLTNLLPVSDDISEAEVVYAFMVDIIHDPNMSNDIKQSYIDAITFSAQIPDIRTLLRTIFNDKGFSTPDFIGQ